MSKIKELLVEEENKRLEELDKDREFSIKERNFLNNRNLLKINNYSIWNGKDIYSIHIQGTGDYLRDRISSLVLDFEEDKFGNNGELFDEFMEDVGELYDNQEVDYDYFDEDNYYIKEE